MRLRDQVIGALNLFRAGPARFDPADLRIGQALADVATISLLHVRKAGPRAVWLSLVIPGVGARRRGNAQGE